MPARPKSTAPVQQQLLPPPRSYDESDGIRRTLLFKVTRPLEREALVRLSRMLDRLLLEQGACWDELGESSIAAEVRAAAADLVYLAEFLRRLEEEHDFDPYNDEDRPKLRLCRLAKRQAVKILRIADALGAALPALETGAA